MGWMALIWWLSSGPSRAVPTVPVHAAAWNAGHVVVFGILSVLVLLAAGGEWKRRCVVAVLVTAAYGVVDELHQGYAGLGRHSDPWDVASDAIGGVMFATALLWLHSGSRRALWVTAAMLPLAMVSVGAASGLVP